VQTIEAFLCFDANLPGLERCKPHCESAEGTLCIHRFKHKVRVEYCNTKRFQSWSGFGKGWSDLSIFIHFLGCIFEGLAEGSVASDCIFMILTKDHNFIDDVRKEWREKRAESYLPLVFSGNFISCGGLVVFVQQIDCLSYGSKRADNLNCAFEKVNDFFIQNQRV